MYIFGDPDKALSAIGNGNVAVLEKLRKTELEYFNKYKSYSESDRVTYYDRAYNHLQKISRDPYYSTASDLKMSVRSMLDTGSSKSVDYFTASENYPNFEFIVGQLSQEALRVDSALRLLDRTAIKLLTVASDRLMCAKLKIKIGKETFNSWEDFSREFNEKVQPGELTRPVKISLIDGIGHRWDGPKILRGSITFGESPWGHHAKKFTPGKWGYQNTSLGRGDVDELNEILMDQDFRRLMAEQYFRLPAPSLISRKTFTDVLEIILPHTARGKTSDLSVFAPLRSGRVHESETLVFSKLNGKKTVEFRILRCRNCGIPNALVVVASKNSNFSGLNVVRAAARATHVLDESHGNNC